MDSLGGVGGRLFPSTLSCFSWFSRTLSCLLQYLVIFDWVLSIILKMQWEFESRMVLSLSLVFASSRHLHTPRLGSKSQLLSSQPQEPGRLCSASRLSCVFQNQVATISGSEHQTHFCRFPFSTYGSIWLYLWLSNSALSHSHAFRQLCFSVCLLFLGVLRGRVGPNYPVLHQGK